MIKSHVLELRSFAASRVSLQVSSLVTVRKYLI